VTAAFTGAVLCGGRSRRMGRDKALVVVAGRPLGVRVAEALARAGAASVVAVGGDAPALARLGLATVPDDRPGLGPLGGIVTALGTASPEPRPGPGPDGPDGPDAGTVPWAAGDGIVVVAACDLVAPSPDALAATVWALAADDRAAVAVPLSEGRRHWVHAAWRRSARSALATQLDRGERAVHRAVAAAGLTVVELPDLAAQALADADTPDDLPAP
jgi:molybdopterin-guanine dinucleotide biosynthesis protein A